MGLLTRTIPSIRHGSFREGRLSTQGFVRRLRVAPPRMPGMFCLRIDAVSILNLSTVPVTPIFMPLGNRRVN